MRSVFLAMTLTAISVHSVNAAVDLPALNKELQVMSGIFNTVLKSERSQDDIRIRALDTTYLEGQGVLMDVHTSKRGMGLHFNFGKLMDMLPLAPLPPEMEDGDYEFRVFVDDDAGGDNRDEMRIARETLQAVSEKLRELREQERELGWEMRELERRRKDLEFERRHADSERAAQLAKENQELEKSVAELKARQQQLGQHASELEKERAEQTEQQQKARQAKHKAFLAWFEESVADVLCKYGAGLKAMPQDEHFSMVLRDFGTLEEGNQQDKVYVFARQDIVSCVAGKLTAAKLLQQAKTYYF